MHGLHDALVVVKRHHHRVCPVAAADYRHVRIVVDGIKHGLQGAAGFGVRDDFHGTLGLIVLLALELVAVGLRLP